MSEITDKLFKQTEMKHVLMNGSLEELKQYFIKSEITNNEVYSDLQFNINHAFIVASREGKFGLVKYLLTSPELEIHADVSFNDNYAIYSAFCDGYLYLVDYLSKSPDLKEHAKIPTNPNELEDIFNSICGCISELNENSNLHEYSDDSMHVKAHYSQLDDYYEVLYSLVYHYEVRPTKDIIKTLEKNTTKEFSMLAIKKLKLNEMAQSLHEELKSDIKPTKRIKI